MTHLRPIREADFERVGEVFRRAFDSSREDVVEYVRNLCVSEPDACLVAERDERIGYATAHRAGRVGYLGNLAVVEGERGRGVGRALVEASRDVLLERCDVVGLAVEPDNGRNLGLYDRCGFEAVAPSVFWGKRLEAAAPPDARVRSAAELGDQAAEAIAAVGSWTDEVFPRLDLTRDLEHFRVTFPDRLWFELEGSEVRGVLAHAPLFRGDPWGAVRPGPGDLDVLERLIAAVEHGTRDEDVLWFHVHAAFRRLGPVLRGRGYRVSGHKSCLVHRSGLDRWPTDSDALFVRPWWS